MYEEICIDSDTCTAKVGDKVRVINPKPLLKYLKGEIVTLTGVEFEPVTGEYLYTFSHNGHTVRWYDWRFERV